MKLKRCALLILMLLPMQTFAGQISGIIRSGNAALSNAKVKIECIDASGSGTTDSSGRYSIFLSATGSCTLELPEHNNASAGVFSSNQPTRHDFLLNGNELRKR
jgi:hypothetical protein